MLLLLRSVAAASFLAMPLPPPAVHLSLPVLGGPALTRLGWTHSPSSLFLLFWAAPAARRLTVSPLTPPPPSPTPISGKQDGLVFGLASLPTWCRLSSRSIPL